MNGHLRSITEMNTSWFRNSVEGVSEEQAWRRVVEGTNSLGYVALHVADARAYFAKMIGLEMPNPLSSFTKGIRNIEEMREHPTLAQILEAWNRLADELHDYVAMVDAARAVEHRFPSGDKTVAGLILFTAHHDAYHIGQMSLLRKALGLKATRLM
jgi:uncharacterized damage-inducible protein DinB